MTSILSWNLFQSKLAQVCSYTKEESSFLYTMYKKGKINNNDLNKCDKLDTLVKRSRLFDISKDMMHNIMIKLNINDILEMCKVSKKIKNNYCGEDFWKLYVIRNVKDYSNKASKNKKWKEIAVESATPMDLYTFSKRYKSMGLDIDSGIEKLRIELKAKGLEYYDYDYLTVVDNKIGDILLRPGGYTYKGIPIGKILDMIDDSISKINIKGLGRIANIRNNIETNYSVYVDEYYSFDLYVDYFPEIDSFVAGYDIGSYKENSPRWALFLLRFEQNKVKLYRSVKIVDGYYIAINLKGYDEREEIIGHYGELRKRFIVDYDYNKYDVWQHTK